MEYKPEIYLWHWGSSEQFWKSIDLTVREVGQYCVYFYVELSEPKDGIRVKEREGSLPSSPEEKDIFLHELVDWLQENSRMPIFALEMHDKHFKMEASRDLSLFTRGDCNGCTVLNLTNEQFVRLQQIWEKNNLPKDLFYPETEHRMFYRDTGKRVRFPVTEQLQGSFADFTPKQWEEYQKNNPHATEFRDNDFAE